MHRETRCFLLPGAICPAPAGQPTWVAGVQGVLRLLATSPGLPLAPVALPVDPPVPAVPEWPEERGAGRARFPSREAR